MSLGGHQRAPGERPALLQARQVAGQRGRQQRRARRRAARWRRSCGRPAGYSGGTWSTPDTRPLAMDGTAPSRITAYIVELLRPEPDDRGRHPGHRRQRLEAGQDRPDRGADELAPGPRAGPAGCRWPARARKPSRPRETLVQMSRAACPRSHGVLAARRHTVGGRRQLGRVGDDLPQTASCHTTSTSAIGDDRRQHLLDQHLAAAAVRLAATGLQRVEARLQARQVVAAAVLRTARASVPARSVVSVLAMAADLPTQFFGDLDGQLRDRGVLDAARLRDVDRPLAGDPAGPGGQQHDPLRRAAPPRARCA